MNAAVRLPNFPVDLSLFEGTQHSPSFRDLTRSMRRTDLVLRDYCIPVNSYFPTPTMHRRFREQLDVALKYYPSSNQTIGNRLAGTLGLDPTTLVVANGSTELITWIDQLFIRDSVATTVPTFGRWTDQPAETGKRVDIFEQRAEEQFELNVDEFMSFVRRSRSRAAVLCNPSNPTGTLLDRASLLRVFDQGADLDVIVIDESFIDFADEQGIPSIADEAVRRPNVLVLKSLGKNFGLHGVRAGYAVGNPALVSRIRARLPHWNVNGLAEMLIFELSGNMDAYEASRRQVVRDRVYLERRLRELAGLTVFSSRANYVYVRIPDELDGVALRNRLITEYGYLVRSCGNKLGSDERFFRLAGRPSNEVDLLVAALGDLLGTVSDAPRSTRRHGRIDELASSA